MTELTPAPYLMGWCSPAPGASHAQAHRLCLCAYDVAGKTRRCGCPDSPETHGVDRPGGGS